MPMAYLNIAAEREWPGDARDAVHELDARTPSRNGQEPKAPAAAGEHAL